MFLLFSKINILLLILLQIGLLLNPTLFAFPTFRWRRPTYTPQTGKYQNWTWYNGNTNITWEGNESATRQVQKKRIKTYSNTLSRQEWEAKYAKLVRILKHKHTQSYVSFSLRTIMKTRMELIWKLDFA